MNFETVEHCGRVHVVKNGVESEGFVSPGLRYAHIVFRPEYWTRYDTLEEALTLIAGWMDTWHTISQAAARLVELGAFNEPPSSQMMGQWARAGLFPGAMKILGKGARGSGGSWRIPEAGLVEFMERRKER